MKYENDYEELHRIYELIKHDITLRLREFRGLWERGSELDVFKELVFCLLTPQSRAETCWNAVNNLENKGLLLNGDADEIANELKNVRFRFKKAKYILEARRRFTSEGRLKIKEEIGEQVKCGNKRAREWLVSNIKGMGYKEASHFLRNIGFGTNLAILDRHILKNLKIYGVIDDIPKLSRRNYIEIERGMSEFASKINIPMHHLDFVLWYKETKRIFK